VPAVVLLALPGGLSEQIQAILHGAGIGWLARATLSQALEARATHQADAILLSDAGLLAGLPDTETYLFLQPADPAHPPAPLPAGALILQTPFLPASLVSGLRTCMRLNDAVRRADDLATENASLRASETRYRALFDNMDQALVVIEFTDGPHGPLGDYVHVLSNAAHARHTGLDSVVGKTVREVVPREAEDWIALLSQVLRSAEPIRFERELAATRRYLELAAFRIGPPESRQVAVLFQDITARRLAETRLRELNETLERRVQETVAERRLLADIVEGTDALVEVLDPSFRWLAINKSAKDEFERIYGIRPKLGDCMLDLLAGVPEEREAVRRLWTRALAGEAFSETAAFGDKLRERRWYEMKFNVLRGAGGEPIGAYQFVYDVTERLRDQQRLAEATARMHEMAKQETLGQLTGGVAHDFNNLLTPIMGALELLQRRFEGDARTSRLISNAMQGAERAATLVQRLLTFARRQNLEPRIVDIGGLVEGMRDLIQRSLGPHIPVHVRIEPGLPPARIDPNQFELALLNLAVNGRDAMGAGGSLDVDVREARLPVRSEDGLEPGNYLRLSVRDNGAGMNEETRRRAIEPFFTTKGSGKGTGLGLSMVHGLAAQSGGTLRLTSRPGEGTTAEIWLPAAFGIADKLAVPAGPAPAQARRATILLVDDEELVRGATAEMLREMGHEVVEVASGSAALAELRAQRDIDLLVTDYLMPHMRAPALVREARQIRPGLPVLLITGYAHPGETDTPDLCSLAKPYRETDLAREVARLLAPVPDETHRAVAE
jgi:PAS domain S-box-containing protein